MRRKANATSVNVLKFIVPVSVPWIGSAIRQPATPPRSPSTIDSNRNDAKIAIGR